MSTHSAWSSRARMRRKLQISLKQACWKDTSGNQACFLKLPKHFLPSPQKTPYKYFLISNFRALGNKLIILPKTQGIQRSRNQEIRKTLSMVIVKVESQKV